MDAPNPKRPCHVHSVTSSSQNPNSFPGFNQIDVDSTISSFLSLPDLPLFSASFSIGCSFDRVLDKVIPSAAEISGDEFDQDRFLDRTLQLASLLYKSTERCIRKRATLHNSISWPLLPELTMKVFSMLDTKSLMQASASCTMFNKCATDRVCYSHIDLTMSANLVDNGVVCIMIHRAGKELRSLKLGCVSRSAARLLTRSCLTPLSYNNGFAGGLLRSLHLYYLVQMDSKSLCAALADCSNLTDLKILGFVSNNPSKPLEELGSVMRNCRLIEHLFLEHFIIVGNVGLAAHSKLVEFVGNCPNITSLTLRRFGVNDAIARVFITGFRQLKYMNLTYSGIDGCFLRNLGLSCKDSPLETLILRNCYDLKEKEVLQFLYSLLAGDFKSFRLIDISGIDGLVSEGGKKTYKPDFPIDELKKQRPGFTLIAIFEPPSSSSSSSSSGELDSISDDSSSGMSNYSIEEDDEEEAYGEEEYVDLGY